MSCQDVLNSVPGRVLLASQRVVPTNIEWRLSLVLLGCIVPLVYTNLQYYIHIVEYIPSTTIFFCGIIDLEHSVNAFIFYKIAEIVVTFKRRQTNLVGDF